MKTVILLSFLISCSFATFAQGGYLKFKGFKPYKWMFGVGWNVVDDDGHDFSYMFDYKTGWNFLPYPATLSVDRYLKKGFSIDATLAYNMYKADKEINLVRNKPGTFFSVDIQGKYSFYQFLQPTQWFDPYISIGIGATYRTSYAQTVVPTTNLALGMNFWVKNFGLRLQTSGKLALVGNIYASDADYVHHSVSILYRVQGKEKRDKSFNNSKHGWVHKKSKYKGKSK